MDAQDTLEFALIMLGGELVRGPVPEDSALGLIQREAAGRKWDEIPAEELRALAQRVHP